MKVAATVSPAPGHVDRVLAAVGGEVDRRAARAEDRHAVAAAGHQQDLAADRRRSSARAARSSPRGAETRRPLAASSSTSLGFTMVSPENWCRA